MVLGIIVLDRELLTKITIYNWHFLNKMYFYLQYILKNYDRWVLMHKQKTVEECRIIERPLNFNVYMRHQKISMSNINKKLFAEITLEANHVWGT
jgi:hypothetical protein